MPSSRSATSCARFLPTIPNITGCFVALMKNGTRSLLPSKTKSNGYSGSADSYARSNVCPRSKSSIQLAKTTAKESAASEANAVSAVRAVRADLADLAVTMDMTVTMGMTVTTVLPE